MKKETEKEEEEGKRDMDMRITEGRTDQWTKTKERQDTLEIQNQKKANELGKIEGRDTVGRGRDGIENGLRGA